MLSARAGLGLGLGGGDESVNAGDAAVAVERAVVFSAEPRPGLHDGDIVALAAQVRNVRTHSSSSADPPRTLQTLDPTP
jgi:hypothetical protein